MDRHNKIIEIRNKLSNKIPSIGTWMQICNPSVAEILGSLNYDWVSVDMEHGSICKNDLPDIFRALELGNTLPLARVANFDSTECKNALDAGAGGVILPMIENANQLKKVINYCRFPPIGNRGVGYSRANLFGKNFELYSKEAQNPLIIAMIENITAVKNLESILQVKGLDAIFIGPYDLSASIGLTGEFQSIDFKKTLSKIIKLSIKYNIPYGIHIIKPNNDDLLKKINEGYTFIANSIDAVFLYQAAAFNINK